jgi:DNA-3-methyladenine glycosylase I
MENPQTYCQAVSFFAASDVNRIYHDTAYGFPLNDDNELFGRLLLEINQAGLSWSLILKKQENFRRAYADFDIKTVAHFGEDDRQRLLNDAGIIRNRLKVNAAIHNARRILELQGEFGSFKQWLDWQEQLEKDAWVKLFKKTFRFTGGEITGEFLMSTGYLPGAHEESCPIYKKILATRPAWYRARLTD